MSYVIFGQQVKQHVADTLKKNMKSEGNEKPESAYNKNEAVWGHTKSDNAEEAGK